MKKTVQEPQREIPASVYDMKALVTRKRDELLAAGVNHVRFEYSGSGDDGSIQETFFGSSSDGSGHNAVIASAMQAEFDECASDILYDLYGSWYDSDGGHGTLIVDVRMCKLDIDHANYETISNYDKTVSF